MVAFVGEIKIIITVRHFLDIAHLWHAHTFSSIADFIAVSDNIMFADDVTRRHAQMTHHHHYCDTV